MGDERRRHIRRDDLPPELHPLYDQLQFELQRVGEYARDLSRLRFWQVMSLGGLVVATIINVVPSILRAI